MSLAEYQVDDGPRYTWTSGNIRIQDILIISSSGTHGHYETSPHADDEFSEYEQYDFADWDGSGAAPITQATIKGARRFMTFLPRGIDRPDITAIGSGTIGLEWQTGIGTNRTMIFFEIGPGEIVKASQFYVDGTSKTWPHQPINPSIIRILKALFQANELA